MKLYYYKGYGGAESVCGLNRNGNVCMLTELPYNRGTSITNACVKIATKLCKDFGIAPNDMVVIEQYPTEEGPGFSMANLVAVDAYWFDREQMLFRCPSYSHMTQEQAQELMGDNFELYIE